jgi:DNA-binding response OmpR family regulator
MWYTLDRLPPEVAVRRVNAEPRKKRILCIEDDPEMIELIRLILERKGFAVEGAEGGKAGLESVQANPPDLVLLDLMMPDMDGWDVHQRMRADAQTRHIPIIIVTASAQNIDREFGLHIAKVDDYIVKPFSPQELLASVTRLLGGEVDSA